MSKLPAADRFFCHVRAALSIAGIALCAAVPIALSAAPADTPDSGQLQDVVVTARRVAENEQSVPVPVTAFSEVQLERLAVDNATDLSGKAPNVQIAQTGAGTGAMQVFIRGIGNNALAFNLENPVGVYLDDVYLGRIQGALLDQLDFERIEVLRGPQGTLYGRNSTVGALKYVTKEPDLNESHYRLEASAGDYSRFDTVASAAAPIIPGSLAAKIDVGTRSEVGYIEGVDANGKPTGETANGINRQSARLAVLWLPADQWRANFTADYSVDRSGSTQGTPLVSENGTTCDSAVAPCRNTFDSPYKSGLNNSDLGHNKVFGLSAHLENSASWGSFKSITAFRRLDGLDAIDFSAVPNAGTLLPDTKKQNQISQEFQVASKPGETLSWLAGLFYFRESIYHFSDFVSLQLNDDHQVANSYAVFADATYKIVEGLHLNIGGRESKDDKTIDRAVLPLSGGTPIISGSDSFSTNKATYKIGADYQVLPDFLTYVTYSTGYRPGSYASTYAYPAVRAVLLGHTGTESAANLEVGVKTEWLEHRLRVNLSGFHTAYKDLQQQSSTFPYPITTYNIALKGVELETEGRLFEDFTLFGNLGLLDAHISSGAQAGERPRFTPKVQYAVGGEYKKAVYNGVDFFTNANLTYTSQFSTDDSNLPSVIQDAYKLVGAQIGFEFGDGRYRAALTGKNLTNSVYFLAVSPDSEKFYAPPRMFYGTISARF